MIALNFVLLDLTTEATPAQLRLALVGLDESLTTLLTLQPKKPRAAFRVGSGPADRKPGEVAIVFRDRPMTGSPQTTDLHYPKPPMAPRATGNRPPPPGAPPVTVADVEIDCSAYAHPLRLLHAVDARVASAAGRTMGAGSLAALARNVMRARLRRVQQYRAVAPAPAS